MELISRHQENRLNYGLLMQALFGSCTTINRATACNLKGRMAKMNLVKSAVEPILIFLFPGYEKRKDTYPIGYENRTNLS